MSKIVGSAFWCIYFRRQVPRAQWVVGYRVSNVKFRVWFANFRFFRLDIPVFRSRKAIFRSRKAKVFRSRKDNKQKNTWVLGNTRFISRVEHDISLVRCALHSWDIMFNTRNKSGISAHPCIILYLYHIIITSNTLFIFHCILWLY
jgi:hypothetical protein